MLPSHWPKMPGLDPFVHPRWPILQGCPAERRGESDERSFACLFVFAYLFVCFQVSVAAVTVSTFLLSFSSLGLSPRAPCRRINQGIKDGSSGKHLQHHSKERSFHKRSVGAFAILKWSESIRERLQFDKHTLFSRGTRGPGYTSSKNTWPEKGAKQ
jgi:hypothetical protein